MFSHYVYSSPSSPSQFSPSLYFLIVWLNTMANLLSELDRIKMSTVTLCEKLNLYKHFYFKSAHNFFEEF